MMISVEVNCPDCDGQRVIRHGYTPQGLQRFLCRHCRRSFILPADRRGYDQSFKERVLAPYQQRAGYPRLRG